MSQKTACISIITGSSKDIRRIYCIRFFPKLNLLNCNSILKHFRFFVGGGGGILHYRECVSLSEKVDFKRGGGVRERDSQLRKLGRWGKSKEAPTRLTEKKEGKKKTRIESTRKEKRREALKAPASFGQGYQVHYSSESFQHVVGSCSPLF